MKLSQSAYKNLNIRAEVILAELLNAVSIEDYESVVIQPDGGFNKSVNQDIKSIQQDENEYFMTAEKVVVSRKGMYDALPKGLFHSMSTRVDTDSESSVARLIQKIKDRKEEERSSRNFFAPFDQVLNNYRLQLECEERKILTGFPVGARHTLFDAIWNDRHGCMTNYQKSLLFTMMPLTQQIIGNVNNTEVALSTILDSPVKIDVTCDVGQIALSDQDLVLGCITLSQDFILGSCSSEIEKTYTLNVGPVPIASCTHYLPEGNLSRTLDVLNKYFLPIEIATVTNIQIEYTSWVIEECSDQESGLHRLGYTTNI